MIDAQFDHAIILTNRLEAGVAALERLGFRPTPPGDHGEALGTQNVTVVLPDGMTYFELLAIRAPVPRNKDKRAALAEHGNHLYGLAIKAEVAELYDLLDALGAADGEPFEFAREVDLPDGPREASFTILPLKPDTLPGLYGFVCEHHTPEVVWRADYLAQPNGALRIIGLWGVADDLHELIKAWQRPFGASVTREDDRMTAELGITNLRYLTREAWAERFETEIAPGARLVALEFEVADIHALEALFRKNGVAWRQVGRHLAVVDETLGTMFLFAPAVD